MLLLTLCREVRRVLPGDLADTELPGSALAALADAAAGVNASAAADSRESGAAASDEA